MLFQQENQVLNLPYLKWKMQKGQNYMPKINGLDILGEKRLGGNGIIYN